MLFTANGKTYVVKFRYTDLNANPNSCRPPVTIANCFLVCEGEDPKERPIIASGWSVCSPEDMNKFEKSIGRWYAVKRMIRMAYQTKEVEPNDEFAKNAIKALREQTKTPSLEKLRTR
jgi:hypothetical protein